jgi:hypothetical protein
VSKWSRSERNKKGKDMKLFLKIMLVCAVFCSVQFIALVDAKPTEDKPSGLSLGSNSCYMNALMQNLRNIVPLNDFLLQAKIPENASKLVKSYVQIIKDFNNNVTSETNITSFYYEIQIKIVQGQKASFLGWAKNNLIQKTGTVFDQKWLSSNKNGLVAIIKNKIEGHKIAREEAEEKSLVSLLGLINAQKPDFKKISGKLKNEEVFLASFVRAEQWCQQQDASEAYSLLIDELASVNDEWREVVQKLLYFTESYVTNCQEPFLNLARVGSATSFLSLAIQNGFGITIGNNLSALMGDFTGESRLDGYKLEATGQEYKNCTRSSQVNYIGDYLGMHFKRFDSENNKIKDSVQVPFEFDFYPYLDATVTNKNEYVYELIGFVVHEGGTGGGHYTAYINYQYGKLLNWYYCNDSNVINVSLENVRQASSTGYMYFYKRTNKKSLLVEQVHSEELSKLGSALSSIAAGA